MPQKSCPKCNNSPDLVTLVQNVIGKDLSGSVTRLGDFWNFFVSNALKKKPKCMVTFRAKWKHCFKVKTAMATFLQLLEIFGLLLIFNIWSHWIWATYFEGHLGFGLSNLPTYLACVVLFILFQKLNVALRSIGHICSNQIWPNK